MTTSDNNLRDAEYEPTPEELAGIDRGLRAAAEGRFATDQQVEAVFAKFRRAFEARQFDAAIERDAKGGKLDVLAEEALAEHCTGGSREL
jgi:hypothetical protein